MAARSVMQRAKDRTKDVDAAVDAMSSGNAPPKIGGAIAPGRGGGSGSTPKKAVVAVKASPAGGIGKMIGGLLGSGSGKKKTPQGN